VTKIPFQLIDIPTHMEPITGRESRMFMLQPESLACLLCHGW
jgi:hypothetical protein